MNRFHIIAATSSTVISALTCAAEPYAAGRDGPTVESIRQINAANSKAVTVARFEELLVDEWVRPAESIQADRDQIIERLAHSRAVFLGQMAGASAAERARVSKEMDDRVAHVDDALRVTAINERLALSLVYTADLRSGRARTDRTDLRNLPALSEANGVGTLDQLSLDQNTTLIQKRDGSTELNPRAAKLARRSTGNAYQADSEYYRYGVLPQWVFDPMFALTVRERVPGWDGEYVLEGRKGDRVAFVAVLSRSNAMRVTRMTIFDDSGALNREVAISDYRNVSGVQLPFKTSLRKLRVSRPGEYKIEERTVKSVALNQDVAVSDEMFDIPPEYRVEGPVMDVAMQNSLSGR